MRTARRLGAAVLMAVAVLSAVILPADDAGAYWVANTEWIAGRHKSNLYNANQRLVTGGPHYLSRTNLHVYQIMPAHAFKACQSCGWSGTTFGSVYESNGFNAHDHLPVLLPTNASYAYYDLAAVDLGVYQSSPADTQKVWYYCDGGSPNNCSSYYGGGSAVNGPWEGGNWLVEGGASAGVGWNVCKNGHVSGTSCGTVLGSIHIQDGGWDYWAIDVGGLNNCGVAGGDSGSPVMTGTLNNGTLLGMVTWGYDAAGYSGYAGAGNPCYSQGTWYSTRMAYIDDWAISQAFSSLSLVPLTI